MLVNNWNYEGIDFFKTNPQLKSIFKELLDTIDCDKSKFMWLIAYHADYDSKYYNIPESERLVMLQKLFDIDKLPDNLDDFLNLYYAFNETPARRQLRVLHNKMQERSNLLEFTPYNLINAKTLDDIMKNTKILIDQEALIQKEINKENQIKSRGNIKQSLSDSNKI